jgi:ADP-ribose pyrophosphatase
MGREVVYKGRIVELGLEDAVLPNGAEVRLEIIRHQGAAGVVPLHNDGTVTLLRQYRHAAGGTIWEIPAGVVDPGENPETCAGRELDEEVQLRGELQPLGMIHTTPGFTDEKIWLYLATDLSESGGCPDADESLEPVRIPFAKALQMVRKGDITDAKTICALHLAAAELGWLNSSHAQ